MTRIACACRRTWTIAVDALAIGMDEVKIGEAVAWVAFIHVYVIFTTGDRDHIPASA